MIYVIADDLTGAAECAGVGHRFGLRSEVYTDSPDISRADLISIDTNTRNCSEKVAGTRLAEICSDLGLEASDWIFKKVDSVLRGPVLVEISALAGKLPVNRVLLIPANPSLGRFVRGGHYFVGNQPIHETDFARDPEHPISSSNVVEMLGEEVNSKKISLCSRGSPLPSEGIIVGDVSDVTDLASWANRLDQTTLPAGGAEFLSALLAVYGQSANKKAMQSLDLCPSPRTLFVSGSSSSYSREFSRLLETRGVPVHQAPEPLQDPNISPAQLVKEWGEKVSDSLRSHRLARVCIDLPVQQDPTLARHLISCLIQSVERILDLAQVGHLCVEGGETLSRLVRRLTWHRLSVRSELAPGVVTMQPRIPGSPLVTAKPGSYEWPREILASIGLDPR